MGIKATVKTAIQRYKLISPADRILVAVSGGPDSVALLHLLHELRDELRLELEVAHLHHGIRGEEAKEDLRFVAALAKSLKLPVHLKEINLPQMKSAAGKGNLEALARVERHQFFAEIMRERKLDKAATAHTRDDQAETVVMWFLRGAGMTGLGGMASVQQLRIAGDSSDSITIVRPLLNISKAEVLNYLAENKLDYRTDRTNQDTSLLRNWIRLELLPFMQQRAGEELRERLSHGAELLRDEDRLLEELAISRLKGIRAVGGLDRAALLREATALRRRILRLWIGQTRGHLRGLEFIHIDDMLRLIEGGPAQGRLSIPGGWELVREYELLWLARRVRNRPEACYNYPLEVGVILRIPEANLEFHSERIVTPSKVLPDNLMEAVFDLARLDKVLSVRNFRHGDRFQPLGMTGHKKIKDLFIEKRVPLSVRSRWPLLAAGEEVLWIPGYGRSAVAPVSKATTAMLQVKAAPI
jgi:tRNA(Ile)-lysidine synthase